MKEVTQTKQKKATPFDFINSISLTKQDIFTEETESGYVPFIVNRGLSYFIDTVLYANQMNQSAVVDKRLQYDYLFHSIRRGKRFSRWAKAENNEDLNIIKEYYGFDDKKASEAVGLLSKQQIKLIKDELGQRMT